jgi:hypothetical protein
VNKGAAGGCWEGAEGTGAAGGGNFTGGCGAGAG